MSEFAALNLESVASTLAAVNDPEGSQSEILIQIRFKPDGSVMSANERPKHLEPQDWFTILCRTISESYQPFANGRGYFRLSPQKLAILQDAVA